MRKFLSTIKGFLLDVLFPVFCINCGKEGSYLCEDCQSLIGVSEYQYCPFCLPPKIVFDGKTCSSCRKQKTLSGLFSAAPYDNFIVKKLINQFKYEPFIKELSKPLASLIIAHFLNLRCLPDFSDFILVPLPLHKKKLKQRGFNQAEEIGKELSKFLRIPIFNDVLVKIRQTPAQVDLKKEERQENIKGVFACQKPDLIKARKILLVDDIFTTGSTMEECALALKRAGAKEIWGVVVARG
jgi:ComF family protein